MTQPPPPAQWPPPGPAPGSGPPGPARCQVPTGFFVLGRCQEQPSTACNQCGKTLCATHAVIRRNQVGALCPDCLSKVEPHMSPVNDPGWAARYRGRYRYEAGNRLRDPHLYWHFDHFDTYAFDPGMGAPMGEGDWRHDSDPGLFDS